MKAEAGKKKVVLELGGNAGAIVDETADLDWAVDAAGLRLLRVRRAGLHQRPAHLRRATRSSTSSQRRFVDKVRTS